MQDNDNSSNNFTLPIGNIFANSHTLSTQNSSFPLYIQLIDHIELLHKFQISNSEQFINHCAQELEANKDNFINNRNASQMLFFKTYHSLPSILHSQKKYMYDFLYSFILEFKKNQSAESALNTAIKSIPNSYIEDFLQGITQQDNLFPVLRKFLNYYAFSNICSLNLIKNIHSLYQQEINKLTSNVSPKEIDSIRLTILKHIDSSLDKSLLPELDKNLMFTEDLNLYMADLINKIKLTPVFNIKNGEIKFFQKTYTLSEKIIPTYKYLFENKHRSFTLRELTDTLISPNSKTSLKSLFGDFTKNDYTNKFASAFNELINESNSTFQWK